MQNRDVRPGALNGSPGFSRLGDRHVIEDAIYAAAESSNAERLAGDIDIERADRIVRRFLEELPGELTIADIRAELQQVEQVSG